MQCTGWMFSLLRFKNKIGSASGELRPLTPWPWALLGPQIPATCRPHGLYTLQHQAQFTLNPALQRRANLAINQMIYLQRLREGDNISGYKVIAKMMIRRQHVLKHFGLWWKLHRCSRHHITASRQCFILVNFQPVGWNFKGLFSPSFEGRREYGGPG